MKAETKEKLLTAWAYCDEEDKSTEFMLQYMQDFAEVDLNCVVKFLQDADENEVEEWRAKHYATTANQPKHK